MLGVATFDGLNKGDVFYGHIHGLLRKLLPGQQAAMCRLLGLSDLLFTLTLQFNIVILLLLQ